MALNFNELTFRTELIQNRSILLLTVEFEEKLVMMKGYFPLRIRNQFQYQQYISGSEFTVVG